MSHADAVDSTARWAPHPTLTAHNIIRTSLHPHPPKNDRTADTCVDVVPRDGAVSTSPWSPSTIRTPPPTTAASLEEELAALSATIAAWREKRLAEVQRDAMDGTSAEATTGVTRIEAAMEKRLLQRRQEERVRAQQRLDRLLDTLESRLGHCTAQPTSCAQSSSSGVKSALNAPSLLPPLRKDETAVTLVNAVPISESSGVRERLACERQHLIGCQQLFVEERDARSEIQRQRCFETEVAQLAAAEAEFRACLVMWADSWQARIFEAARATKQSSC